MSLNSTPAADRVHIGIFGKRNAGKSSIINAITDQNLAIVSDIKGTTTDPVFKTMELLPLGPVMIIDTPGLDDLGELGTLRIQKAYQILNKTDIAVLVVDGTIGMTQEDHRILNRIKDKSIPYLIVMNKSDLAQPTRTRCNKDTLWVSAVTGENIQTLKEKIAEQAPTENHEHRIVGDLLSPSDFVLLVVPIDKAAPKGRLILPQQQTIRDILESNAAALIIKENELENSLNQLPFSPRMIITDSQVFEFVSAVTPKEIPLTSFSILFARYKGLLPDAVQGAKTLNRLKNGDTVLISEGCTHHRQCNDIGSVKLPKMIQKVTGKALHFKFTSGTEFPLNLDDIQLIVHCGGCMLNDREMHYRLKCAVDAGIPMTNYGILMAHIQGILDRCIAVFEPS